MIQPAVSPRSSELPLSEPILRLAAVTRQYSAALPPAVREVSLTLQAGELLSLLGPSGCGKTTLLRLIAGFEAPQSGRVELAGEPVAGEGYWLPPEQRGVGMVFQDYALFPHLTVAQNIGFGLGKLGGKSRSKLAGRIQEVMALVGLQGLEDRFPHQLSGGQQQRVALARALAPSPVLVLLDEPLSNLDVQVRLRLRLELRQILRAAGTSAVLVTHDQEEALSISDRVAVMRQGQIEQIGTPETLYREPASRFVAEFVTQANFLPAQMPVQMPVQANHSASQADSWQANSWQTSLGALPAARVVTNPGLADHAGPVALMLRQDDLELFSDPTGNAVVQDRQFLGREYRYQVQADDVMLVVRAPVEPSFAVGETVRLTIASTALLQAFPG